ncbi:hypothetical protein [Maritimibacter sp. UBA3975]|mgnify:CR=1 FL=1|uniref:hypothetical protein n=1 Tax=Maritimibacter sp. UBA3975 TaxID=1946833 RepID=UPI000C0B1E41|nr:hypothetical protein [Maritimibacter sp. UBA3975]MAM63090.1 hypothetical protein [Maritimibacter sp.]|tara:strand:- start:19952 stop:20269 length:318 start_codon:yes stop_codon:yes gene_type:complete
MFPAALGAVAPLALAGKAISTVATLAAEGKARDFQNTVEKLSAQLDEIGVTGDGPPGTGASRRGVVPVDSQASAPLPPPPAVSQTPIPPTVEGIHDLYATLRAMR